MSQPTPATAYGITVDLDAHGSAYLAYTADEEAHPLLRATIVRLIADGTFRAADYDIGARGGLAFKLGTLDASAPYSEIDNMADACEVLEGYLEEACTQTATAVA